MKAPHISTGSGERCGSPPAARGASVGPAAGTLSCVVRFIMRRASSLRLRRVNPLGADRIHDARVDPPGHSTLTPLADGRPPSGLCPRAPGYSSN